MLRLLIFLICLLPALSGAGVYKWTDEQGNIHYSDRPREQAEPLSFPGLLPPAKKTSNKQGLADVDQPLIETEAQTDAAAAGGYRQFQVLEPEENQTFRSDEGVVSISLLLEPALQEGHELQVILDGQPVKGRFLSTQMVLHEVPRGNHSLQASIVDSDGTRVADSNSVPFHVRWESTRTKFADQ